MIFLSTIGKILLGFGVLMLVTFPIGGPFLFFISVVCTLGVGLIVWIPLSYAVGSFIVNKIYKKQKPAGLQQKTLSNEQLALVNYINQAKQSNLPENEIFLRLKGKGWAESQILSALGGEAKVQEPTKETPTTKPDGKKIVIVVLIVVLVVAGIYFMNARNSSQSIGRQRDRQRISGISNIKYAIESYYTRYGRVPKTLSNIDLGYSGSARDPKTRQPYQYSTYTETTYKICTTFETSFTSGGGRGYEYGTSNIYYHPQGYHCFNIQIPNQLIKSNQSTIKDSKTRSILAKLLPNSLFRSRCYNLSSLGSNLSERLVSLVPWSH